MVVTSHPKLACILNNSATMHTTSPRCATSPRRLFCRALVPCLIHACVDRRCALQLRCTRGLCGRSGARPCAQGASFQHVRSAWHRARPAAASGGREGFRAADSRSVMHHMRGLHHPEAFARVLLAAGLRRRVIGGRASGDARARGQRVHRDGAIDNRFYFVVFDMCGAGWLPPAK